MSRPYRVGLTGGIGSGKSVIAAMFSRLGAPVIDADNISRELTKTKGSILQQIVDVFGHEVVDKTGNLNRTLLRDRVFSDELSRQKLEAILHPHIYERMISISLALDAPYCIMCIPLLLETHKENMVDRILVIDCPVDLQIQRTVMRDNLPRDLVEKIVSAQISRETRLKAANDIILNADSVEYLEDRVEQLHFTYLKLVNNSARV